MIRQKLLALCGLMLALPSTATVITSPAVLQRGSFADPDEDYVLSVDIFSNESGLQDGNFALGLFDLGGGSFEFGSGTIGHEFRIYEGLFGDSFGVTEVNQLTEFTSNLASEPPLTFSISSGETLFFPYWVDQDLNSESSDTDNFGWLSFQSSGDELLLADSVVSTQTGIIVGTQRVPEPSALLLAVVALMSGVSLRRRRS